MQSACDSLDMGFGEGSFTPSDADLDMGFGEGTTASEADLDMGFGEVHAGDLDLDMGFDLADSVHAGELDLDMGFGPPDASVSTASNMSLDMGFGTTSGSVSGGIIGDDRSDISIPPSTLVTTVDPVIGSSDPTLGMEVGEHTLDMVDAGESDLDMGFGEGFGYGAVALGSDSRVLSWYHVHSTTDRPCSDLRRGDRCTHHHQHGFRRRPLAHRSRHGIR